MTDEKDTSTQDVELGTADEAPENEEQQELERAMPTVSSSFLSSSQAKESGSPAAESRPNRVDLDDLRDKCFFLFSDKKRRLSRFWLLMILATVIATSGVAGDSAATVIGAMIVAPLMTPIQGTMLGIVLGDKKNFGFSLLLVLTGSGSAILIAYLYGLGLNADTIFAENNSQIANRVQPKLTDLVAALATGAVASIALVRKDIADAMPGVAIAISLVPPLCVVGLTLSTGRGHDAAGASLLFATNVASILVLGVVVMYIYKVQTMAAPESHRKPMRRCAAILGLFILLVFVAIPLGLTSQRIHDYKNIEKCLEASANEWAEPAGWKVSFVIASGARNEYSGKVIVTGPPPFPDREDFPEDASACGVNIVEIVFAPLKAIEL